MTSLIEKDGEGVGVIETTALIDGRSVSVEIQHGVITAIRPNSSLGGAEAHWTVGLMDIHQHGAAGAGYDTADLGGTWAALREHRRHGTSHVMISLVSAPPVVLVERLRRLRGVLSQLAPEQGEPEAVGSPRFAGIQTDITELPTVHGVHLEGPFLSPERKGAHDAASLRVPTLENVELLLEAGEGLIRQVTIAPELPGALSAIERFVAAGVVVAVGHTQADYDQACRAFEKGASLLTHAYNAMPGFGHRSPGPIGAALVHDHVSIELIADGIHVHPVVIRSLFAAAPGRVVLVSDAMAATGMADGSHRLGEMTVDVQGGRPVLEGTDILAGSALTLDRAIGVTVGSGVAAKEAIEAATTVPARAVGIELPAIEVGMSIDKIVAFDGKGRRVKVTPSRS